MTVAIHEEAKREFKKAFAYYEAHQEYLGHKFSDEYNSSLDQILAFPEAWPPFIKEGYRRKLLHNFPFGIVYKFDDKQKKCLIYAIMHLHRKSDYWEDRKF